MKRINLEFRVIGQLYLEQVRWGRVTENIRVDICLEKIAKMNIAYFLDIPYGLGGAGNLLLQQAVLMSELHNVVVVIPADKEENYNTEYTERCKRYGISYRFIRYSTSYSFSLIDYKAAMEDISGIEIFAKKEKINFFHSVQLNISVEFVSRKLGIPHLMNIYQLNENDFKICPGDIYPHYHLCDSFLYSSRWKCQLGINSRCIRPVAPLKRIKKKEYMCRKKIKILMLGSICTRKNQIEAIKAIEECMNFSEIELHIAGSEDNNYAMKCRKYVQEHGLEKNVIFHGFVSRVESLLESSDCFLCSSTEESFPSSIVEAITYDLTVISTPVAGVPELMVNERNAFISRGFSHNCIAESILQCVKFYKNGKIADIHKNAERTWMENFDRSVVSSDINFYYCDIKNREINSDLKPFFEIEQTVEFIDILLRDIEATGEEWVYGRSLYYAVVKEQIGKGSVYIWGAGRRGKLSLEILKRICPEARIMAFIDSYKDGYYCGIPIMKTGDIPIDKNNFYCVSFVVDSEKAVQYLEKRGMELNREVWIMP